MLSGARRRYARIRRAASPVVARPSAARVLRTPRDVADLAASLPPHSTEIRVVVDDVDLLRHLTLLGPGVTAYRCVLVVTDWERPHTGWSGRAGHVPDLVACAVRYPLGAVGAAEVDVTVGTPTPVAVLARAAFPMLAVDRGHHGQGITEIGTSGLPPAGLALLPTRTAPGVVTLPGPQLQGVGLSRSDLGLHGPSQGPVEHEADDHDDHDDPELHLVTHPTPVAASGHLVASDREDVPLLDLHTHNPVGRRQNFERSLGSLRLELLGQRLSLDTVSDDGEVEGWVRPAAEPLLAREVRTLRDVEAIDLSGLAGASDTDEALLARRLAELAATGTILHSLPTSLERVSGTLGAELTSLLRAPYRSSRGVARELRSVPQRREAMKRFGGFYELADHAESLGQRLLPSVSVVLSSARPARVVAVLQALARQTYPRLEVVLALHGHDGPLAPDLQQAVDAVDAQVHRFESTVVFGAVLAELARRSSGDLVVKIDDDDVYGSRVIEDLVMAYVYSGADVVGKTTEYLYFEEIDHTVHRRFGTERYHHQLAGGTMMLSQSTLGAVGGWRSTPASTDRSVLIRLGAAGGTGYRTHSLGYVYVRHTDGHTWRASDSRLLQGSFEQWPGFVDQIVEA